MFSQSYDNVFTFSNEVTNLYRTARITVQFTAREKDDGYQHVMLYDGASSLSTLLAEQIFEHGGNKKETSPARYEFVFEIDILYLSNKSLCEIQRFRLWRGHMVQFCYDMFDNIIRVSFA